MHDRIDSDEVPMTASPNISAASPSARKRRSCDHVLLKSSRRYGNETKALMAGATAPILARGTACGPMDL